jgi:hypothetical protein
MLLHHIEEPITGFKVLARNLALVIRSLVSSWFVAFITATSNLKGIVVIVRINLELAYSIIVIEFLLYPFVDQDHLYL